MSEGLLRILKSSGRYFLTAASIVIVLFAIGKLAPYTPSFVFIFIFPLIAVPSTIGALYSVVVNRIYRQEKLTADGKFAFFNRRWSGWLLGFFALSLLSSVLFVLQSPKWETLEWVFLVIAVPMYYVVYLLAMNQVKKELTVPYRKAAAMKISFFITGAVLSLLYATVSVYYASTGESITMVEALGNQLRPFESSHVFLLNQLDFFSSFFDGLAYYVQARLSSFFLVSFVYRFILYAGVFFGLVNLFGFSLLDCKEMKSEFRLLPDAKGQSSQTPLIKKYILILAGVWFVFSAVYLGAEFEMAKQYEINDGAVVEDEMTGLLKDFAKAVDDTVDHEADLDLPTIEEQMKAEATEVLNVYYDECAQNIDSYVEWTQSGFGGIASLTQSWGGFGEGMAKDAFMDKVAEPVDLSLVQRFYVKRLGVDDVVLSLWEPLQNSENIRWYLLGEDTDGTKEALEARLNELIDASRSDALASLGFD